MPGVNNAQLRQNMMQRKLMMDRINELGDEISVLSKELLIKEEKLTDARSELADIEDKKRRLMQEMEAGRVTLEQMSRKVSDSQQLIQQYESTIGFIQKNKDALSDNVQILHEQYVNKENDIAQLSQSIQHLEGKRSDINQQIEEAKKTKTNIDHETNLAKTRLEEITEEANAILVVTDQREKDLQDYKQNLDTYKEKLNIYAARLNTHMEEQGLAGNIPSI